MSAFVLKMIATLTMLLDHTGVLLMHNYDTTLLRFVGRIAFPIYAFLIAEGCRHTRNIKRYFLGLVAFALISELPFDMLFSTVMNLSIDKTVFFDPTQQNVFFTLALGVAAIWIYKYFKSVGSKWYVYAVPVAVVVSGGYFLKTDYDWKGVLLIFLLYFFEKRSQQIFVLFAFSVFDYWWSILYCFGGMLALPALLLYNGKRGYNLKWFFYLFYPLHILILFVIWHNFISLRL